MNEQAIISLEWKIKARKGTTGAFKRAKDFVAIDLQKVVDDLRSGNMNIYQHTKTGIEHLNRIMTAKLSGAKYKGIDRETASKRENEAKAIKET